VGRLSSRPSFLMAAPRFLLLFPSSASAKESRFSRLFLDYIFYIAFRTKYLLACARVFVIPGELLTRVR
jgi:hypothetical protein